MGQALDIVNRFMQSQDPSLLADDFSFIGPVDQTKGIDAFMKLNASFFPLVTGMRMLKQFEQGHDVCSIYEMDLASPSGTSLTLNIADWVVVNNGKMVQERLYYDTRAFAAAFGR
jgi:ketosteroid isomerase-like protein